MKINCGPPAEKRSQKYLQWHPHFAWWPARLGDHDCRWLETVERKFGRISGYDGLPRDPEYRVLSNQPQN